MSVGSHNVYIIMVAIAHCRVILPEERKTVSTTLIVSCTAYQAIRRDQVHGRKCKTGATIGKNVDITTKDLVVFPCKPRYCI